MLTVAPGATAADPIVGAIDAYARAEGLATEAEFGALKARMGGMPLGRKGEPAEFVAQVGFPTSPAAGYLSGVNFASDGGSGTVA